MQKLVSILDKILTVFLQVLVVLMVLCITAEIVLNAMVQPIVSGWIVDIEASGEASGEPSAFMPYLQSIMGWIAELSSPINTASQTLLVWIGILGSALALRYRSHLGVDALVRVYPPKIKLYLDYLSTLLIALFSLCVLTIGGYIVCQNAFMRGDKMPGIEELNRGWFYLVLLITGVINLIYCIYHFMYPKPVESVHLPEMDSENT